MVTIEQITADKKQFMPLLLLADEQESMINRYLERGDMFAMYNPAREVVCVAVITQEGDGVRELKNIAVPPQHQRKGYGKEMVEFLCQHYSKQSRIMYVGTGDSKQHVSFYTNCGFKYSHCIPNFFTLNYEHPIIEDGKILTDMLYFRKHLANLHIIPKNERTATFVTSLVELWKTSVRESHHFLGTDDIENLIPFVHDSIQDIEHLIVLYQKEKTIAFIGIENQKIEMLFVAPDNFGQGFGKTLINIAIKDYHAIYIDVNELNQTAENFYKHIGFQTFERTNTDEQGNPFPILKMKLI